MVEIILYKGLHCSETKQFVVFPNFIRATSLGRQSPCLDRDLAAGTHPLYRTGLAISLPYCGSPIKINHVLISMVQVIYS